MVKPVTPHTHPKESSGGLGFFGWYFLLFFLALIIAAIIAAVLYFLFKDLVESLYKENDDEKGKSPRDDKTDKSIHTVSDDSKDLKEERKHGAGHKEDKKGDDKGAKKEDNKNKKSDGKRLFGLLQWFLRVY